MSYYLFSYFNADKERELNNSAFFAGWISAAAPTLSPKSPINANPGFVARLLVTLYEPPLTRSESLAPLQSMPLDIT